MIAYFVTISWEMILLCLSFVGVVGAILYLLLKRP